MTTPTTPTEPDLELFLDTFAHIESHPDSWEQCDYGVQTACGTAYCFAGHAMRLRGIRLHWEAPDHRARFRAAPDWYSAVIRRICAVDTGPDSPRDPDVNGAAARALGISLRDAWDLFHPRNTLDHLYRIAARILDLDEQVLRDKVQDRVQAAQ